MKQIPFKYFLLCIVSVSLIVGSCSKDDDDTKTLKETFFEIENASFVNSNFPEASTSDQTPVINSIYGNGSVLAGGSNPITINTSSEINSVIVGVQDEKGYFEIPVSATKTLNSEYIVFLIMSQELELDNFTIIVAVINSEGLVSAHQTISVSLIEAGTGQLQVSCSWDQTNDVDLHLVEPNGTEIYYGNSYSSNGGELDVDSNADCYIDNINNENITYGEDAIVESGEYIVRVDLYSNCSVVNNTNYVVTVYYNGTAISPSTGQNPYYGSFAPGDADYGGAGSGETVVRFNISSSKSYVEKSDFMLSYKFDYPDGKESKPKNLSPNK